MTWVDVTGSVSLETGRVQVIEAEGVRVAVCRTESGVFAIEDVCSHDSGPLDQGELIGDEIECPRHGARFDVRTGKALRLPAVRPVKSFPARERDGRVEVEFPTSPGSTAPISQQASATAAASPGTQSTGGGVMTAETSVPTMDELREKLRQVNDPEINLSIVDLGLVYDISFDDGVVLITMTLTSPGCPLGPVIRGEAYAKMKEIPGVKDVDVQIVWNPPWDPRTMASEDVRMMLGIW